MLGTSNPEVSKAIPFINDLVNSIGIETMGSSTRFSWALVHPSKKLGLRWCRLETQAAHCSDRSMSNEFHSWAEANSDTIPFPTEVRHPNYARTELIRLSAHLNRTVPVVRDSGAKTAVIVDEHFFTKISHVHALEGGLANKLAQAEVVWLVTRFEEGKLIPGNVIYSRLDDSIRALLAGPSVGKKAFEDSIRRALADPSLRGTRVFKL